MHLTFLTGRINLDENGELLKSIFLSFFKDKKEVPFSLSTKLKTGFQTL